MRNVRCRVCILGEGDIPQDEIKNYILRARAVRGYLPRQMTFTLAGDASNEIEISYPNDTPEFERITRIRA